MLLKIIEYDFCGVTMYRCPVCLKFGRPTKKEVKQHMWERHVAEVEAHRREAAKPAATLFTSEGKLVEQMPMLDDESFAEFKRQIREETE